MINFIEEQLLFKHQEVHTDTNNGTAAETSSTTRIAEFNTGKFKATVNRVMKKIKVLAKVVFEIDDLPDPATLPVESYHIASVFPQTTVDDFSIANRLQETDQDNIDLKHSSSKTGTCILYRDNRTKNCIVKDISNATSCCGFFEWYSCYHVMPDSARVIVLDINLNIVQAFHSLAINHTRAAPVWDAAKHQFVAMFTITDFIKFLHKYYVADNSVLENIPNQTINDWREMLDTDPNSNLIHIYPEDSLRHAALVIDQYNIHRLPVIDPVNGNVLAVITNSQLFRFFYERFSSKGNNASMDSESFVTNPNIAMPSYFYHKICDLELGHYNEAISTIHPWQTVYEAFDIFVRNQISVLPVVDDQHRLIDIYARYDVIVSIAETGQFRNVENTISDALNLRKQVMHSCTCSKDDSFATVLRMIYQAQVHRIFVVDTERHILGIISLTDILSFLCKI